MEWSLSVGSSFDREEFVAYIFCDKKGIIEISQERGFYEIAFYGNTDNEYPLSEVLDMIKQATEKLDSLKRTLD